MKILALIGAFSLRVLVGIVVGDYLLTKQDSLDGRVSLIEEKMRENYSPRIQVNTATIWNTEGEIVIEEVDYRKRE